MVVLKVTLLCGAKMKTADDRVHLFPGVGTEDRDF